MSTASDMVGGVAAPRTEFASLLRRGFNAHGLLIGLALAYVLVLTSFGLSGVEALIGLVTFSIPAALLSLILFIFGSMVLIDRPDRPAKVLWRRFKGVLTSPERMARGLPLFAALIIFMYGFTVFKANITTFIPFTWDETLDRWDVALHFGYRPFELMHPLLGIPLVTWLLNVNYNMWFFVMNMFWVYYAFLATPGWSAPASSCLSC